MKTWIDDLRYAWRRVCHSPGFSLAAVLMLGLGIGASVAMYSVLQGVILSGMPYPGGDRVVAVSAINPRQGNVEAGLTQAEAQGFAEAKDGPFEAFGYYDWNSLTVLDADKPRELSIARVSAGFFHALGVAPLHGRWFEPADMQGQDGGVILSFTEWQRLTGRRPGIDWFVHRHGRQRSLAPGGCDASRVLLSRWRDRRVASVSRGGDAVGQSGVLECPIHVERRALRLLPFAPGGARTQPGPA
jgi:hypothetical protein